MHVSFISTSHLFQAKAASTQKKVESSSGFPDSDIPGEDIREFLKNLISKPGDIRELLVDLISSPGELEPGVSDGDDFLEDSFETPRESRRKTFPLNRRNKFIPKIKPLADETENEIESEAGGEVDDMSSKLKQLSPEIEESEDEMLKTVFNAIMGGEEETRPAPALPRGSQPQQTAPRVLSTDV